MFKSTDDKFIPNQFLQSKQQEYIKNAKIKSRVKNRQNSNALKQKTNKLQSIKDQVKPQKLILEGYEKDSSQEDDDNVELFNPSILNKKQKQQIEEEQIIERNNTCSQSKGPQHHKFEHNNNKFVDCELKEENYDIEDEKKEKQKQKNNKNIFSLDLSDSDNSQNAVSQSQVKGGNFNPFEPSKAANLHIDCQSSSQEENKRYKQEEEQEISEKVTKVKKFTFDNSGIDSEDDESLINCEDQKEMEQNLSIIKKINIDKMRKINTVNPQTLLSTIPIPEDHKLSLIIKRDLDKSEYTVFDSDSVSMIMKVEKRMGGNYKFVLPKLKEEKQGRLVAKMKVNFLGTQFDCYLSSQINGTKIKKKCLSINYQMNILGLNGPRKVSLIAPYPNQPLKTEQTLVSLFENNELMGKLKKYQNKKPKWFPQLNAYVLNMRGTAIQSSVKNCVIVQQDIPSKQFLIFGKKSRDVFNLDIKHPFTIFQGVAFAISSFEKKLGCE